MEIAHAYLSALSLCHVIEVSEGNPKCTLLGGTIRTLCGGVLVTNHALAKN